MKRFVRRVVVLLLAAVLVSCGGGGGDGGGSGGGTTSGGGSPPAGTPANDTGADPGSGGGTAPGDGSGTTPGSGGGTTPGDGGGTTPGSGGGTTPGDGGGTTPGSGGGAAAPATERFEETDPKVVSTGVWTPAHPNGGWSAGAAIQSTMAGATLSFTFSGTSVRWIGRRSPKGGIAVLRVDGGEGREVDLYSRPDEIRAPIITLHELADGEHTLTIEVTGRKNSQASASSTAEIVVDAFEVNPQTVTHVQETDSDVTFTGTWLQASEVLPWSGGGVRSGVDPDRGGAKVTETAGSKVVLTFRGTSVAWSGYRGPDGGIALVRVNNGDPIEVDTYAPSYRVQEVVFTASGLPDRAEPLHTLTIEATGLKNAAATAARIFVDAFDVTKPGRRYEQWATDPRQSAYITYTGTWIHNVNRVWSEGETRTSVTPGSRAIFRFKGSSVSWISCQKSSIGRSNVWLDGVLLTKDTINNYKGFRPQGDALAGEAIENYQRDVYRIDGLNPEVEHVLEIEAVSSAAYTVVDAFDVRP